MKKYISAIILSFFILAGCMFKKPVYKVTMVELMSSGCHGCEAIKPIVDEIQKEYKGRVKFIIYDIATEEGNEKAGFYGLKGTPTLIFLDEQGVEYFRLEKLIRKDIIEALLNTRFGVPNKK